MKQLEKAEKKLLKDQILSKEQLRKQQTKKVVKKQLSKQPNLLAMSEYLQTIMSPETIYGSKVPDGNMTPSFVSHCVQRRQITAGSGASNLGAGLFMVVGSLGASAAAGADLYTGIGGASNDAIVWTPAAKAYAANLTNSQAVAIRPISASLTVQVQCATNTDQGRIIVNYQGGPAFGSNAFGTGASINNILNLPYVTDLPASKRFARTIYLPSDDISRSYCFAGNGNFPYRTNPATAGTGTQYGALQIYCDGLAANTVVEFTLTENFECLPAVGLVNFVAPTPSQSDPIELSLASNALAKKPQVSVEQSPSQQAAGTASVTSTNLVKPTMSTQPSHEPASETFFERVLNGVEKYGPLVARGAKIVSSLL